MKMKIFLRITILTVAAFFAQSSFAQRSGSLYCGGQARETIVYVNTAYWIGTITVHADNSIYSWAWGAITGTNTWSLSCDVGPCTKTQTKVGPGYKYLTLNCNSVSADDNDSHTDIKVTW